MNEKLLNKDLTIRILSVMLALLLWYYVITEQNPEIIKDITVPVRLINTVFLEKNNMMLVDDPNNFRISLKLQGKKSVLDKLNETTVSAIADLEGHNLKGENFIKINISGIPEGVDILTKSAESLKVILEPKVSVQKSVKVNIMGNPSQGLAAMTPILVPNDVIITGAESKINRIKSVRVDVDIASVNSEVKRILPVRVLDENNKDIQNISIDPGTVEVTIPIENTKRVSLELDLIGEPALNHVVTNITIQPRELLVTGKKQALEGINSLKTERIDINGQNTDVSKEVKLIIPEGIELVNANEKVTVHLDVERVVTKEITVGNIEYVNLADGLEVDSIKGGMVVSLKGAESLLNDPLNSVRFYVDLTGYVEGTNLLDLLWEAPPGVEVVSAAPQKVEVVLKKKAVEQ